MARAITQLTTPLQKGLVGSCIIFSLTNAIFVCLRIWSRRLVGRSLGWSDYLIVNSCLFCAIFWGITSAMVLLGGAGDEAIAWVQMPETEVFYFKSVIASTAAWLVACYSCKLSVVILYHNLFSAAWGKVITPIALALTLGFGLTSVLTLLLVWRPLNKWWDGTATDAEQVQMDVASRYVDVATCLTDFLIYCLPIRTLWTLKMEKGRRLGYMITFSIGFLTCAISLFRTLYNDLVSSNDEVQIMLGLESTFGVISACVPTVGPIYYKMVGKSLDPATPRRGPSGDAVAGPGPGQGHALVTFGRLPASRQKHTYDSLGSLNSHHRGGPTESQTELNANAKSGVAV